MNRIKIPQMIYICIIALCYGYYSVMAQSNLTISTPSYKEIYPTLGNDSVPPYLFTGIIDCTIGNTFSQTISYTSNSTLPISIESDVSCNIYFFYKDNPSLYSIAFDTNSFYNNAYHGSTTITIPITGNYLLLVTSKVNEGKCNITIGSNNYYNKDVAHNTFEVQLGSNVQYNFFTSQSTHNFKICVLNGSQPGTVIAFNDNYVGANGEFQWGNEARILKQHTDSINGVIVFANYDYSPFAQMAIRTTDLYMGCLTTGNLYTSFENLNPNDAIQTAPPSYDYNCHAWACGLWNVWHDPAFPYSIINATLYQRLSRFDNDYLNRGYTREGATESNSVIDLWVFNDNITHSSIKSKGNEHALSYSWESKAGNNCRFMHPRYSLESSSGAQYGNVMYHYRKIDNGNPVIPIYNNIYFSEEEIEWITNHIKSLPSFVKQKYVSLYQNIEIDFKKSCSSNLKTITTYPSYKELEKCLQQYPDLIYLTMDQLNKGSYIAACIIVKNSISNNTDLLDKIWPLQYERNDFVETILSSTLKYSKALIAKATKKDINNALQCNTVTSNKKNGFDIEIHNSSFAILFNLKEDSHITISLASDKGVLIKHLLNEKKANGFYRFNSSTLSKGTYIVSITINGRIYTQKIGITQ